MYVGPLWPCLYKIQLCDGMFGSKICNHLNGLSFSQVLVLNMNFDVFQPYLKDYVCHGWVSNFQYIDLWFRQFE